MKNARVYKQYVKEMVKTLNNLPADCKALIECYEQMTGTKYKTK